MKIYFLKLLYQILFTKIDEEPLSILLITHNQQFRITQTKISELTDSFEPSLQVKYFPRIKLLNKSRTQPHSNFALIECNRTQIANSLIISKFVCTQSLVLNYTQKMD